MTHCNNIDCPCADRAIERAEVERIPDADSFGWGADRMADRIERQGDERW